MKIQILPTDLRIQSVGDSRIIKIGDIIVFDTTVRVDKLTTSGFAYRVVRFTLDEEEPEQIGKFIGGIVKSIAINSYAFSKLVQDAIKIGESIDECKVISALKLINI